MNRVDKTADLHENGGLSCSQSILTVFGPAVGLTADQARVLGRPLCGINVGKHGVCGYIGGAAVLLGLSCNRESEALARSATTEAVDRLCHRFKAKNGHLQCKHLVGADMSTPEGRAAVKEHNLIARNCYGYGRDVAAILEEML